MAASSLAAAKMGGQSKEQKANLAAQTDLAKEQTSLGRLLRGQGEKTFSMSAPAYNQGLNYYKILLNGGPGALRQLMSSENSLTNQAYQSAKLGLEHSGIRGGVGEQAKADLNRQRAGQVAGMVPGMRSGAADKLLQGGSAGMGASQGFGGSGVTGLGNAGLTYASMGNTYDAQQARNERMWSEFGGSLGQMLLPWMMGQQAPKGPGAAPVGVNGSRAGAPVTTPGWNWGSQNKFTGWQQPMPTPTYQGLMMPNVQWFGRR